MRLKRYRSLYVSFDRYPSSKGAATHIQHAAHALAEFASPSLLLTLGTPQQTAFESGNDGKPDLLRFREAIPNFLQRTNAFASEVADIVDELASDLEVCHFRDPWGGEAICQEPNRSFSIVYEVNGLPSIELPYRFPQVRPETLAQIAEREQFCLAEADQIIVPSQIIAQNLQQRGTDPGKITTIPNGAATMSSRPKPADAPKRYLLYFGAMQPWQGVPILFRAFARLLEGTDINLVICSSVKPKATSHLRRLTRRFGIADRVHWHYQLPREILQGYLQHAIATVAPLTECSRNLSQGCCPLKILESLAAGVPVVASDLPVTRELLEDGVTGRLIQAGRPEILALALQRLIEDSRYHSELRAQGRALIEQKYSWDHATERQLQVYRTLNPSVFL